MTVVGGYSENIKANYPTVIAIVQAQLGSQRFPGKMMADLGGRPLLVRVIQRLKQSKSIHQVVVASPDRELVKLADDNGAWGYHDLGDPNNVLSRFIKAANWSNAEIVVRICGDCPCIDPAMVDEYVGEYFNSRVDIVTNVARRTFPKGLDIEVLHRNTLKRIHHLTDSPLYREHVTLHIYENPALYVIKNMSDRGRDHSYLNVSIDTKNDLDKVAKFVSSVNDDFSYIDVIQYFNIV